MLKVESLTKHYGPVVAVQDVSFQVEPGEIIGFLGPNGAGKSTTMKILTCFMTPTAGTASLDGLDILDHPLEVRRRIGYLPENTPLYRDMRVSDYLRFVLEARRVPRRERPARLKRAADTCGLGDVVGRPISELSRGYRQRVGIAQALIHEPLLLILDEPTSGMDPKQTIEIRNLIRDLGKERTVILSTHILPEVSVTCSRVLIINRGRLVASGTPAELQRKARGGTATVARIRGPRAEVGGRIAALPGVEEAKPTDEAGGVVRWDVRFRDGADRGEELFALVRDGGWSLLELRRESATLEDIFVQLTS